MPRGAPKGRHNRHFQPAAGSKERNGPKIRFVSCMEFSKKAAGCRDGALRNRAAGHWVPGPAAEQPVTAAKNRWCAEFAAGCLPVACIHASPLPSSRWGQVQPDPTGRSATGKRRDKIGSNCFATSQRSAADCLAHHLYCLAMRPGASTPVGACGVPAPGRQARRQPDR